MSGTDAGTQIQDAYAQWNADNQAEQQLKQEYEKKFEQFLEYCQQMGGGKSAGFILMYFMTTLMPMVLEKQEDDLTLLGDGLDILSGYRSAISQVQSEFNGFNSGEGNAETLKQFKDAIEAIRDGIALNNDSPALDSGTTEGIKNALNTIEDNLLKGGKEEYENAVPGGTGWDNLTDDEKNNYEIKYLNDLWDSSKEKEPTTAGTLPAGAPPGQTMFIPGATASIKVFGEQFNTVVTTVGTVSQAQQTSVQYKTSGYQQFLGMQNSLLQSIAKGLMAIINNQRVS